MGDHLWVPHILIYMSPLIRTCPCMWRWKPQMEYLDKENMADVDQKQEKIEDERKIMRRRKKKLGGIKTMPFIFGMFANSCSSRTTVFSYCCFCLGLTMFSRNSQLGRYPIRASWFFFSNQNTILFLCLSIYKLPSQNIHMS